jgi:hypothetical protein
VWFAGAHSDVGGYPDHPKDGTNLSDAALRWMALEAGNLGLRFKDASFPLAEDVATAARATMHNSRTWKFRQREVKVRRELTDPGESPKAEASMSAHESTVARLWDGPGADWERWPSAIVELGQRADFAAMRWVAAWMSAQRPSEVSKKVEKCRALLETFLDPLRRGARMTDRELLSCMVWLMYLTPQDRCEQVVQDSVNQAVATILRLKNSECDVDEWLERINQLLRALEDGSDFATEQSERLKRLREWVLVERCNWMLKPIDIPPRPRLRRSC